jgi:(1->4)-alpha-D-glucan 1-alpha-D-glucosylmutase
VFRAPTATYRLQFNAGFRFEDGRRIVPYLADLGITDLYASPILKARRGSNHGYDVVDANALNPELGTDEEFGALHGALREHGLGLILDIVPNHMAASHENSWWMSVLENGPQSRFFHYFDIDLRPVTSRGRTEQKILLPILGAPYGETLEAGEIKLAFDLEGFYFRCYEKRLPLVPKSYAFVLRQCVDALPEEGWAIELRDLVEGDQTVTNSRFLKETLARIHQQSDSFRQTLERVIGRINGRPGHPDSFNDLDTLLDAQHYRLAYWRIASEKINYRRFFDVTDLVGVRIENPEVFEARNRRHFEMIGEGKVTGLRIDHIDGLHDPAAYLKKLQLRLAQDQESFYVVVEKILEADEELPKTFSTAGTTGYDFLGTLNDLLVDPAGLKTLDEFYRRFTGVTKSFADICYERKKQVIHELFSGEMRALGKKLGELSLRDRNARDFTPSELLAALTEITACMSVYRTYLREPAPSETDRACLRQAIDEARRRAGSSIDPRVFRFLEIVLLIDPPSYLEGDREAWLAFIMRWQQFTGRVMAKGVEDTAFYNYARLISLNEVGGEPGLSGHADPVAMFHARNERIQRDWPQTMNATSTHDTKRSEDVRARINVLSEIAGEWSSLAEEWSTINAPLGPPDRNMELLLYQTLLGMWPLDDDDLPTVRPRLLEYLEKASREAKTCTSWLDPNVEYENKLKQFAASILEHRPFCESFDPFQKRIAYHGFLNALAQVVLKITSPGLPDFYQGTELWDFSLVDPDNRRPVDYAVREAMLRKLKSAHEISTLLRRWFDGRIKLFVTWKTLGLRSAKRETFKAGAYTPLQADSPNVVAFMRGEEVIVAVPRLTTKLAPAGTPPVGEVWGSSTLSLPVTGTWRNIYTGDAIELRGGTRLAEVFARFPVAALVR